MSRFPSVALVLFLVFLHLRPCSSQENDAGPPRLPAPRIYHSLVWVDHLEGIVMTGGHSALGWEADLRDMWLWQGADEDWKPFGVYEASPKPSDRDGGEEAQAPAYDRRSGQLIALNSYGETWAQDLVSQVWTRLAPDSVPSSRCGHDMAYDSESDRVILFGGFGCMSPEDPALSETWAFDLESGQWTRMEPPTAPSPRMYFGMAYHPDLDRVVVWGGRTLAPIEDRSVWLYDFNDDQWETMDLSSGPDQVVAYPRMVYRPDAHDLLMFGGTVLSAPFEGRLLNDTWRLDLRGGAWERMTPENPPPPVAVHGSAYDPVRRTLVVFGGEVGKMYSNEFLEGTWLLDTAALTWRRR